MNRIDRILFNMDEARKTILVMTGMTEEELNEMQWSAALECVERILRKDEYGKNEIPKQGKFWDWWKDQWYRRDRVFLDRLHFDTDLMKYSVKVPQNERELILHHESHVLYAYQLFHKVEPDNKLINSAVLEYSFSKLMRELKSNI
jgi:hypothetical protein